MNTDTPVGFIGIGVMGKSMAGHILAAGYPLHIHTRTKFKAVELIDKGAVWHDSAASLAAECDVIFTIVGFPNDVNEVYLGDDGILANMKRGTIVVDMTTSKPELAVTIAAAAKEKGGRSLDAPVSGGDTGARDARLSIMVGGDADTFDTVLPLFELMGRNIVYQGPAGSGQHCKMCNQITIASTMLGVCEAMAYAEKSGLDPETVLRSISAGAAGSWSLSNLAPRMLAGQFEPGFYVKHFIKDMTIAADSARAMGLDTPGLDLAKSLYEALQAKGGADDGTQGLYKLYL
ncbi:MAG: NAD(P)-dependent oxidoreductase [Lentisphaeria bacterium]|nr:NAD(P)-dependent oxidoreductase [Lentisphaeria bacterium]